MTQFLDVQISSNGFVLASHRHGLLGGVLLVDAWDSIASDAMLGELREGLR